ncbi:CaiB/BaiF CoA-transferase family protein [Litoribacillus peritrichatus]|uniref:CoA transferase n=1 Tax=Litoribacillus peritrichatus TaxID=718191 RepID=A0ABP7M8H1_9GAMM
MTQPLSTLKVLDFSTLLPGPYATMLMADMGAEVLRVVHPTKPDLTEALPPIINGMSALHAQLTGNKTALKLDLKQSEATERIKALILEYDIIVEQFRPGVMKSLGLDYDTLKALNPNLIYCSITGYGQTGPYADRAGHDINYLALSGIASYSGTQQHGPTLSGIQIADIAGGSHHAVMGILSAVIERHHTQKGQHIDISMTDCAFSMNVISGAPMLAGGATPGYQTELLNGGFFYDYYPTADGRYLSVGSLEPKFIQRLSHILDKPTLAQKSMNPTPEVQAQIKGTLKSIFLKKTLCEWREIFANEDVCVEPVLTLKEASEHPQLQARAMIREGKIGDKTVLQISQPIKFSH